MKTSFETDIDIDTVAVVYIVEEFEVELVSVKDSEEKELLQDLDYLTLSLLENRAALHYSSESYDYYEEL